MLFTRANPTHRYRFVFPLLAVLLSAALAAGCVSVPDQWSPLDYTVKKGDTLYSIAWRYEMDFQDIARWNDIPPPYAIYPGERLHLSPDSAEGTHTDLPAAPVAEIPEEEIPAPVDTPAPVPLPATAEPPSMPQEDHVIVGKGDTLYAIARERHLSVATVARWNALKPPYRLYPGQVVRVKPPMVDVETATASPAGSAQPRPSGSPRATRTRPVVTLPKNIKRWLWPAKGTIVRKFKPHDTSHKGIAIRGTMGETIHAAAAGKVVYSGNGLLSYGNLVIIKHNNTYLSAYAHNRKLLVNEGELVSQGQAIAQMGKGDRGHPELHFEIRRNGKPINPLALLP